MGLFDFLLNPRASVTEDSEDGLLKEPGDKLEARVTESGRQVIKVSKERGNSKYSATKYPNGTVVETRTTKKNRKN